MRRYSSVVGSKHERVLQVVSGCTVLHGQPVLPVRYVLQAAGCNLQNGKASRLEATAGILTGSHEPFAGVRGLWLAGDGRGWTGGGFASRVPTKPARCATRAGFARAICRTFGLPNCALGLESPTGASRRPVSHFIHEDFLLETDTARDLYHRFAKPQPIFDYHCHLSPEEVADNHEFRSMTELWLGGDHYKWRAMRTAGVDERCCTGAASDWEKFYAWSETVPKTLRNPLYHWTHLELAFPFGIRNKLLDATTAEAIYSECNARLKEPAFRAQGLLAQFNVALVCTTDDPVDSLEHHLAFRKQPGQSTELYPTWRPDRAIAIEDVSAYNGWLDQLAAASNVDIVHRSDLLEALRRRHAFFHEVGCRLSDHGVETMLASPCSSADADRCFEKLRQHQPLDAHEALGFKSLMLYEFALMDHERGWVQQFHIGALRDNNSRLLAKVGPNTGFDSIGDDLLARPLARFLDRLDSSDQLAKTILYNSNPRDNELMATMIGNFQGGGVAGKLQFGSAWWFLDQLDGMQRQLNALSTMSLLYCFVGMLTDSRSFLSYSRHDYFRRLLCNLLGNDVKRGWLPSDRELLGSLVRRVCYENARDYLQLGAR